jgi:hypothetical protein
MSHCFYDSQGKYKCIETFNQKEKCSEIYEIVSDQNQVMSLDSEKNRNKFKAMCVNRCNKQNNTFGNSYGYRLFSNNYYSLCKCCAKQKSKQR